MPKKKIVVVEDDSTIRSNLRELLEIEGYQVETASHGQEGYALIERLRGNCLVLLDLQMPIMTGEQLLKKLSQDPDDSIRTVSVVILTARVEPVTFPVSGFLRKPIDLDILLETVSRLS